MKSRSVDIIKFLNNVNCSFVHYMRKGGGGRFESIVFIHSARRNPILMYTNMKLKRMCVCVCKEQHSWLTQSNRSFGNMLAHTEESIEGLYDTHKNIYLHKCRSTPSPSPHTKHICISIFPYRIFASTHTHFYIVVLAKPISSVIEPLSKHLCYAACLHRTPLYIRWYI